MTRRTIEQRLVQLDNQRRTLQARISKQERAKDTRRKVLLGALVLERLEHHKDAEFSRRLENWLQRELPGFLTRDGDRALFADLLNNANSIAGNQSGSHSEQSVDRAAFQKMASTEH
jgi:hypothetical protein